MPSIHSFHRWLVVLCASFFVSTSAFYVSGNDVKIDNTTKNNITADSHTHNDSEHFLVNDKNGSDGFISLNLGFSSLSHKNEGKLEKNAFDFNKITNETIGGNLSNQNLVRETIIHFNNENDLNNKIYETSGQSPQHNLNSEAETVYNNKGNKGINTELTIEGNSSVSTPTNEANETSANNEMKSLDGIMRFTTISLLPSESTSSIPKMRDEEMNDKYVDVNKTEKTSHKITKEDIIVQKENQKNRLVQIETLPVNENISGYPYHYQLPSTVQTLQKKSSNVYPTGVSNDQMFVTTDETMPNLLTSLVPARTYVDIIDDDAFQTDFPNNLNPTNNMELMHHLGVIIFTEIPNLGSLEIDDKHVMAEIKTPKVKSRINNHDTIDTDKLNKINYNMNKIIDHSTTAFPEPSKVDIDNKKYFRQNIDDTETKGYLQNFDEGQKQVVKGRTKNDLQSNEDSTKEKTNFENSNNTFELRMKTSTDDEKTFQNVLKKDKSFNTQANNETTGSITINAHRDFDKETEQSHIPEIQIDITEIIKNSLLNSLHTNRETNNSGSFPVTFWNLAQFAKNDHDNIKGEGTESQNMDNFKTSNKTNHRHETKAGYKSHLREYDDNDGVTSETQILPTVLTVDSNSSKKRRVEQDDNMNNVYRKELSKSNEGTDNFTFEISKIHTTGVSSKKYTKETNRVHKDEGRNLYSVRPSYKRFKKLEVLPLKPFRRDPNDNTWRNQSISSLGIVFKANANVTKPLTVVLKNKTETDFIAMEDRENRTEPELRERLEKLSELRKAKRKFTTPKYSKEENRLKEDENKEQGVGTTIPATTSTTVTPKATPAPTTQTTQNPFYFKSTPRPFEKVDHTGMQRHDLAVKKVNNENAMYYDKVDDENEKSEFIPYIGWELLRNVDRVAKPDPRKPPAQYYIPAEQLQASHKFLERRLHTSINEATNGVKIRSENPVGLRLLSGRDPEFLTRESPAPVSVFNRGDDHGTISYAIDHTSNDNVATGGRMVHPNRNRYVRDNSVGVVDAILPPRAARNEEDYDYHDRLQMTDLEKFSFTYNSDRFMADVPLLFDTGVVRLDTKPAWQSGPKYLTKHVRVPASSEAGFDSGTDYPPSRQ